MTKRLRKTSQRVFLYFFLVFSAGYVLVCLAVHFSYKPILFPAPLSDNASLPVEAQRTIWTADDGRPVHAVRWRQPQARDTIVYFHGNGVVIGDEFWMARELFRRGFSVVLVEYRGYGLSQGIAPSEVGIYRDARGALAGLTAEGVGADKIVLWGQSLGTGVAVEMARQARGSALILISPYTSIADIVQHRLPYLPVRWLLSDRFESLTKASEIHMPTFVLHGTDDEVIPWAHGERLAQAVSGALFQPALGAHHGDIFLDERARYFDEIAKFLTTRSTGQNLPPASTPP